MPNTAENYLVDLGKEVLSLALDAQRESHTSNDGFQKGRQTAFYEVLSLMKQQAQSFGLDDEAIGLNDVNLEELLR